MTKTEAREYLKRIRLGVREAEQALKDNDAPALYDALEDLGGCAGTLVTHLTDDQAICTDGKGVGGLLVDQWGAQTEPDPA